MGICELTDIRDKKINLKDKNILSTSFFIKEYSEEFKKKYEKNLIKLILSYKKIYRNYKLYIFTDKSFKKSAKIRNMFYNNKNI